MVSSGDNNYKYFIGYKKHDHKIKLLDIMFPKTNAYLKSCDGETKWKCFSIEDDELLEKQDGIWNKVSNSMKNELCCEPNYNKKILTTKTRPCGDEATDFQDKEIPTVGSNDTCLAIILLDSVPSRNENYHSQVFLKECKQIEKERLISDSLEKPSDSDKSDKE